MPRRNRRHDDASGLDEERARRGAQRVVSSADEAWLVRSITITGAVKTYRCPGCDHEIRPGVPHLVVWPADERGDAGDRRHWHSGCWAARHRR